MSNNRFFTDGKTIFRLERAIVVLENVESQETIEVECQEGGRLKGFEPVELKAPQPVPPEPTRRGRKSGTIPQNISPSKGTPRAVRMGKTSKYVGVLLDKPSGKWKVQVFVKGKGNKWGGLFSNEIEAAKKADSIFVENGLPKRNFP
jgi:hypothetical protein